MKTKAFVLSVLLLSFGSIRALADGTVIFSNVGAPPEDRIYYIHWSHTQPGVIDEGPTPLSGANYHIALYWGPQGTPEQALAQFGPAATFQTFPIHVPGTFSGGTRTITSPSAGPVFTFQARAWSGDYPTYEAAFAAGGGPIGVAVGKVPVFDFDTADPGNLFEQPRQISDAPGWQGFCIDYDNIGCVIPEPSTFALGLLALAALPLLIRRRS